MKMGLVKSIGLVAIGSLILQACSTPTLVEVARRRQASGTAWGNAHDVQDNVAVVYRVTDLDVLNFSDEVKRKLRNRSNFHMGAQYGAVGTQATLGALAGAAETVGWGVATASGLGLGATYVFGMGKIFDSKAHAQAYEQAYTAIQAAEAKFYFYQLGMRFKEVEKKYIVDPTSGSPNSNVPSGDSLSPDGERLYYRVTKILKVLDDALSAKIPDLQDLKDANGEG
jgi:hypothetical protein